MSIHIQPLETKHIEEAATLVALRYQAERTHNQLLPAQFEQAEVITSRLQEQVGKVPGVAAIRDNRLVGFLLGLRAPIFGRIRGVFSPDWGHAADSSDPYNIYRAMYAELSQAWLVNGCFAHAIQVYTHEHDASNAWFSLGFGMRGMDALRDLSPIRGVSHLEIEIRQVRPEDFEILMPLVLDLCKHLAAAPIFLPLTDTLGQRRTSHKEWLENSNNALWLAFQNGAAVGYIRAQPSTHYNLAIADDTTVSITGAFTCPEVRGSGVGAMLLNHVLKWARSQGCQKCAVDCETANIPGHAFWRKHFQPICYALVRSIDERLAWANETREAPNVW